MMSKSCTEVSGTGPKRHTGRHADTYTAHLIIQKKPARTASGCTIATAYRRKEVHVLGILLAAWHITFVLAESFVVVGACEM